MALNTSSNKPARQRIRTLRPWHLVGHEVDNGTVVGIDRRVVEKGEVIEVSAELARQLVVAQKAEVVPDTTPLGTPKPPATSKAA